MDDLISRKQAIDAINEQINQPVANDVTAWGLMVARDCIIAKLPSAQPEPLTDVEQRIFLAAMGKEEKVCEEVDRNNVQEPYENSLMSVCRKIKRKVKDALWT